MHGSAGVAAATGNLLVRRRTFAELDGFADGIRSAGDVDFCWRMLEADWTLEQRPDAAVAHHHREDLVSFLAMIARYGAGSRWLNERHPGAAPHWPLLPGLAGSARDVAGHILHGRIEPAAFRALDGIGLVAHTVGYRASNNSRHVLRSR
jgi:GT2 family glycosyltransferase